MVIKLNNKARKKRIAHHVDPHEIRSNVGDDNDTKLAFALRFNDLLKKKKIDQKDFAENTKLSDSSVSSYRTGKSEPQITALKKIADELNVSADYLIGNIDDVKALDPDMRGVCKFTRLSEKSIEELKKLTHLEILNILFENEYITEILDCFNTYLLHQTDGEQLFSIEGRTEPIDNIVEYADWRLHKNISDIVDRIKDNLLKLRRSIIHVNLDKSIC